MVISGIAGLGHLAMQYAVALGPRVIAVDISDEKLNLAKRHGAEFTVNARNEDPAEVVSEYTGGGSHGVLVTAVHPDAFGQAVGNGPQGRDDRIQRPAARRVPCFHLRHRIQRPNYPRLSGGGATGARGGPGFLRTWQD